MSDFYDGPSRYKKRRVVTHRGGGNRRRDESRDAGASSSGVGSGHVGKPGRAVPEKVLPKPVWMTDEEYKKQQGSIVRAIQPLRKGAEADRGGQNPAERGNETGNEGFSGSGAAEAGAGVGAGDGTPMASEDVNVKLKYLKTLQAQGKDEIVRDYYNTQTFHSRQSKRTESPIYRLRSFNNCIKYILINKYGKPNGTVLELGCGKGGDLAKWGMLGTRQFVGIDLSDESIREAIKRYRNGRYDFQAVFATGDAFNVELPEILKDFNPDEVSHLQFDNVSMQFCMHYAFSSEASVESMLANVSKSLRVGGMFVGTIPSSDFIKWKLKKLPQGEHRWGNSIYSVTFPDLDCFDREKGAFVQPFGNVYNYFLKDAVEDVPEYVVPFEKFRSMCEEHGLELRYKKNFFDMFNKEVGHFFNQLPGPLIQSLRLPGGKYGVANEEREACSFYLAFAFERV